MPVLPLSAARRLLPPPKGFMTAFPDMVVKMDAVSGDGSHAIFRWIWTGTNTGPGGTGQAVRIKGLRGVDD